jgi:hypothetical protein
MSLQPRSRSGADETPAWRWATKTSESLRRAIAELRLSGEQDPLVLRLGS